MKSINTADPREKLTKARMQLLMAFPFFGELVMRMVFHESKTAGVGTTCVDHKGNMYYNPDWVNGFTSVQETMFELAHEVMHLVQRCTVRFPQGGNHQVWNIAADIKVDSILVDAGLKQSAVSQKNITDELMEQHRGKTTEQIYYHLIQNPDEVEQFGGCPHDVGEGGEGPKVEPGSQVGERGCTSGALHGEEPNAETVEKWKQHVIAAAMNAQKRGKSPAFADEFMAEIRKPSVTWKEHLRRVATSMFRGRYGYPRPNRRARAMLSSSSSSMQLPSRTRSPNGAIIAIDTSGSISDDNLSQFVSECSGILRETGCKWLKIFFHDVNCYHIEEYDLNTIKKIKATRGGTSHIDVFDKINETQERIGMVIAFTDLETSFPDEKPPYPVLWAHPEGYENHQVPWGTKVKVKLTK
jgi:predicted metal-dependent peptidase